MTTVESAGVSPARVPLETTVPVQRSRFKPPRLQVGRSPALLLLFTSADTEEDAEDAEDRPVCPPRVASVTKNPRDALELPTRRPAPSPTSAGLKAYSSGSGRKYGSGEFLEPRGHLTNDLEPLAPHTRPGWRRPRWGLSKLDAFLEVSRNLLNPTDHPGPVAPLQHLELRLSSTARETPADRPGPGWERSVLSPGRLSLSRPERTLRANQAANGVKRPRRSGGL